MSFFQASERNIYPQQFKQTVSVGRQNPANQNEKYLSNCGRKLLIAAFSETSSDNNYQSSNLSNYIPSSNIKNDNLKNDEPKTKIIDVFERFQRWSTVHDPIEIPAEKETKFQKDKIEIPKSLANEIVKNDDTEKGNVKGPQRKLITLYIYGRWKGELQYQVYPETTVADLKLRISKESGLDISNMRLMCSGSTLGDSQKLEHGIENGSKIVVMRGRVTKSASQSPARTLLQKNSPPKHTSTIKYCQAFGCSSVGSIETDGYCVVCFTKQTNKRNRQQHKEQNEIEERNPSQKSLRSQSNSQDSKRSDSQSSACSEASEGHQLFRRAINTTSNNSPSKTLNSFYNSSESSKSKKSPVSGHSLNPNGNQNRNLRLFTTKSN